MINKKSKNAEQIVRIVKKLREEGKTIVTTNGTFDLLHAAHVRLLEKAKNQGDILIVLMNSDSSVRKFKGDQRPVYPQKERAYNLSAMTFVDYIVIFDEDDPLRLLKKIKPHIHAKGGTFIPERIKKEKNLLRFWGGKFVNFELEEGYSSTNVIEKILDIYKDGLDTSTAASHEERQIFNRENLKIQPLSKRKSKSSIKIMIKPSIKPTSLGADELSKVKLLVKRIKKAKRKGKPVLFAFGAHLIKNGLSLVLIELMKKGFVNHILGNGAVSIHDWEFAYQGKTEEDVGHYMKRGQFGLWDETGKYINSAILKFAKNGYGMAVGKLIWEEKMGKEKVAHPNKRKSILGMACKLKIPVSICPGIGYDIIHTHPTCDGSALGKASHIDFLKLVKTLENLSGGVFVSIGSAITAPMVFEKALSMANNISLQKTKKRIDDFMIFANDIQPGDWNWTKGEPPKNNPAYYLRFNKTFSRMGGDFYYLRLDNRDFVLNLFHLLQ
jgi:rfaE bifunctional protein nucleotidyltransferase chain/domain